MPIKKHTAKLDARDLIAQHCLAYGVSPPPPRYVDAAVAAIHKGRPGAIADLMWDWFRELRDRSR